MCIIKNKSLMDFALLLVILGCYLSNKQAVEAFEIISESRIPATLRNSEMMPRIKLAIQAGRPIIFVFHQGSDIEVFKSSVFKNWARNNVVFVDQNLRGFGRSAFSDFYGVRMTPTILLLDPYGNKIAELDNYTDPGYMCSYIQGAIKKYKRDNLMPCYHMVTSINNAINNGKCLVLFKPKNKTQVKALEEGLFKNRDFLRLAYACFEFSIVLPENEFSGIDFAMGYIEDKDKVTFELINYSNNKIPEYLGIVNVDSSINDVFGVLTKVLKRVGYNHEWLNDPGRAEFISFAQNKPTLYWVTGNSCPISKRLYDNVISSPEFEHIANENLVLCKIDLSTSLPKSTYSKNLAVINRYLTTSKIKFPTLILAAPDGKLIGYKIGYLNAGLEGYINWFNSVLNDSDTWRTVVKDDNNPVFAKNTNPISFYGNSDTGNEAIVISEDVVEIGESHPVAESEYYTYEKQTEDTGDYIYVEEPKQVTDKDNSNNSLKNSFKQVGKGFAETGKNLKNQFKSLFGKH